jgi:hypothetical protein
MLPSLVVTDRQPVQAPSDDPDGAGRWRGGPDPGSVFPPGQTASPRTLAPVGEMAPAGQPAGPERLAQGDCYAWPLPPDATCASVARDAFRSAAGLLSLPDELRYDGVTMASELAANTMHAKQNVEFDGAGAWPLPGAPELWIYLRRAAGRWELVCKVFDSLSGWNDDLTPVPGAAGADSVSGRGLQVVAGLSAGRWGYHLTRSRFGGWKVPGKAVWFGQPVPARCVPGPQCGARLAPGRAARALEGMLAERGLGGGLLRAQAPSAEVSVLSVRCGLTVWCRDTVIWWRTPDGRYEERVPTDLVDTAEELVSICEEMDRGADARHAGLDRVS